MRSLIVAIVVVLAGLVLASPAQAARGSWITSIVYWTGPNCIPVRYSEGFYQHQHDLRQILRAALLRSSRSVRRRRPDALRHHNHVGLLAAHQRRAG